MDTKMDAEKEAEKSLKEPETTDKEPNFETLLDTLGHFGLIQRVTFALLTLTDIMNGIVMMNLIFAPATPNWRCTQFEGMNMTNITRGNETFERRCQYDEAKCIEFDFDKDYRSISTEWGLVCDRGYIPKLTTSVLMFGVLVGAFVFAQLADMFGRRPMVCMTGILIVATQIIVGTSVNWQMYTVLRFFVGVWLGGSIGLCFVMPMEFIGPKWRSFCGALGLFDVGHSVVALLAWWLHDWRYLAYASGAVGLPLVISIMVYIPESGRWLIQKERFEDAAMVIKRMARVNKTEVPDLSMLRRVSLSGSMVEKAEARYTYADLFSTRKYATRTLVTMFCWFSVSCIFYNITISISSLSGSMYLNTVLAAIPSMFMGWSVVPVAHWLGRKKSYLLYTSIPIASMFSIVILEATGQMKQQALLRTILALIGKAGIGCSWILIAIISAEIYPTLIRTMGVGIGNTTARVGGIIAPQIVFLGDITHWTVPYIINGTLALTCLILVMILLPETAGKPLPEDVPPRRASILRSTCCVKDDSKNAYVTESGEQIPMVDGHR